LDTPLTDELWKAMFSFKRFGFPGEGGLSHGEFFLLKAIQNLSGAGVHVSRLRDRTATSLPAVSQQLGALERKQLIARSVDAADRRKIAVSLTPKGEALVAQITRGIDAGLGELIARLGEEETRTFIRLSRRLAAILEEMRAERFF